MSANMKMTPEIEHYFAFMATKLRIIFMHNPLDKLDELLLEAVKSIFVFGAGAQRTTCKNALDAYCMHLEKSGEEFSLAAALKIVAEAKIG